MRKELSPLCVCQASGAESIGGHYSRDTARVVYSMSDCGVCLTFSSDGESTGYRCAIVKAGKHWKCSECGRIIPKGSKYELASGFNDVGTQWASHWQYKTCLICAEIANAFYCNGRWHGSSLWDSLYDVSDKMTVACLNRLRTPEAKAELQRRWMKWKGLA